MFSRAVRWPVLAPGDRLGPRRVEGQRLALAQLGEIGAQRAARRAARSAPGLAAPPGEAARAAAHLPGVELSPFPHGDSTTRASRSACSSCSIFIASTTSQQVTAAQRLPGRDRDLQQRRGHWRLDPLHPHAGLLALHCRRRCDVH